MALTAAEVKVRHEKSLLQRKGVVGVAVGSNARGASVLVVYIASDDPKAVNSVPAELDGITVVTEEVEGFEAA